MVLLYAQETYLKANENFNIKEFTYHKASEGERAAGGSSVFIKNSIPQKEIKLNTQLQATAVSINLQKQ